MVIDANQTFCSGADGGAKKNDIIVKISPETMNAPTPLVQYCVINFGGIKGGNAEGHRMIKCVE